MNRIISPVDPTSCVRDRDVSDTIFHGTEAVEQFLADHLMDRDTISDALLPGKTVAMLYGRPGSGKTSAVCKFLRAGSNGSLGLVFNFRIQPWNLNLFKEWIALRLRDLELIHSALTDATVPAGAHVPERMTLVIGGLHRFNYLRGNDDIFTDLMHLLARVRAFRPSHVARVLLLCDESPGQFPGEFLALVDRQHILTPPEPDARGWIFRDLMFAFKKLADTMPALRNLGWDILLRDDAIDQDPTHIVHSLVVASSGCTPREIHHFMQRTFAGCLKPKESGDTVYNAAWIEALLFKLEGNITCITASNPAALNESCFKHAGLGVGDAMPQLGTNNKSCFVRDVPLVLNPNAGDNAAPEMIAHGNLPGGEDDHDGSSAVGAKRARLDLQPPSVTEALQARLNQQGEALSTAARNAKRIAGRERDRERYQRDRE